MSEPRATYRVRRRPQISQREAHRLRKRVKALEDREEQRTNRYSRDYPGGVHIATIDLSQHIETKGRLYASQLLGAALVARSDGGSRLEIYAVLP